MIELAIAGGVGGLVKSLLENKGRMMLPNIETVLDSATQMPIRYVHLGFITNVILGTSIAYFTTTDLAGAFSAGMATAYVLEKGLEMSNQQNTIKSIQQKITP